MSTVLQELLVGEIKQQPSARGAKGAFSAYIEGKPRMKGERMDITVTQGQPGVTHIDWLLDGVTARMIDWFWSNMEKANLLWHPDQHEPLQWYVPPAPGNPVGSVHIAPQTRRDGTRQNIYIRMQDLRVLPPEITDIIAYDHCYIGGGHKEESIDTGAPMGYRVHQWQATDAGVIGRSTALPGTETDTAEEGLAWVDHCRQEIRNWGVFLPDLYRLYRVVTNPAYNPFADLTVERKGRDVHYKYMDTGK